MVIPGRQRTLTFDLQAGETVGPASEKLEGEPTPLERRSLG